MLGKNIETLTNELVKVTKEKTLLLDKALKLVMEAIEKQDEVTMERTDNGHLLVKGKTYGKVMIDLDEWFKTVKITQSAEVIGKELIELIMIELHGEPDHLL